MPPLKPPKPKLHLVSIVGGLVTVATNGTQPAPGSRLTSWNVQWGDGSTPDTGIGNPPTSLDHTYASAATFVIIFTVVDANGLWASASMTVQVTTPVPPPDQAPVASLAYLTGLYVGTPITVSTVGTQDPDGFIASGSIDWGDGQTTTFLGPPESTYTHTYAAADNYVARLAVTDDQGVSGLADATIIVIVQPADPPPPDPPPPTPDPDPIPANDPPSAYLAYVSGQFVGDTYTLSSDGTEDRDGTLASGTMDWGDGTTPDSWSGNPPAQLTHVYLVAASYLVTFRVVDDQGAPATVTRSVIIAPVPVVNQPPIAKLAYVSGIFAGSLFTFSTAGTTDPDGSLASGSITWGDGQSTSFTGAPPASPTHTYAAASTPVVTLHVVDNHGLTASTTVNVTVNAVPPPPPSTGRNGYYTSLLLRPDVLHSYSLRDQSQLNSLKANNSLPPAVNYLYPADPYVPQQDAAKVVIPPSVALTVTVAAPIGTAAANALQYIAVTSMGGIGNSMGLFIDAEIMLVNNDTRTFKIIGATLGSNPVLTLDPSTPFIDQVTGTTFVSGFIKKVTIKSSTPVISAAYSINVIDSLHIQISLSAPLTAVGAFTAADVVSYAADAAHLRVNRAKFSTTGAAHSVGAAIARSVNSLQNQVWMPWGGGPGHKYLTTWDVWYGNECKHSLNGLTNWKTFQTRKGTSPGIWYESRTRFDLAPTVNDVGMVDSRGYSAFGPNVTRDQPLSPQAGTFVIKPQVWLRHWELIDATQADYIRISHWVADENNNATLIYDAMQFQYPTPPTPLFIHSIQLEFNTSTDTIPMLRGDLVVYTSNFVILQDWASLPDFTRPLP